MIEARVVDEEAVARRADARLRAVEEVEPLAAPRRRLAVFAQLGEEAVELGRADPRRVLVVELRDSLEQARDAAAGLRRGGDDGRPLAQAALEPRANVLDLHRRLVPLGEHDERRALRLARDVGDGQVLLDDALRGVDEHERDVRAVRGLERAQLREVLDALAMPPLSPHARGVHEHERAVVGLEHGVDRVARRSRDVGDDQPLLAEQRVEEAGLADVGPPSTATRIASSGTGCSLAAGQPLEDGVEQVSRAMPVEAGDRHGLAEAERRELVCELGPAGIVELVRDEQHRLACPAQDVGELGVARRQPCARVDDEEHEVGLLDRRPRLGDGAARDRRVVGDVDAARVHEQEALACPLAEELLAVAGHSRRLVDDRGAGRGQPVDERRLADVRVADDGDGALELVRGGGLRHCGRAAR